MREDHTELVIILDRSGSMSSIKSDMEGGLNQFIEDQKKEPGQCTVTLTQFDNQYEVLYEGKKIDEVPKIELVPRGSTALLDAVAHTLGRVVERHSKMLSANKPKVLVQIVTDGHENASTEVDLATVKKLIEEKTAEGWVFAYIGANQDSFAAARGMGVAHAVNYAADSKGVKGMSEQMTRGTSRLRSGGSYNTN